MIRRSQLFFQNEEIKPRSQSCRYAVTDKVSCQRETSEKSGYEDWFWYYIHLDTSTKLKTRKEAKHTKRETQEIDIRQSWKAPYTDIVPSFCISLTKSVWHEHRQPSGNCTDSPRIRFLKTVPPKKYCQTCPCPAALSKKWIDKRTCPHYNILLGEVQSHSLKIETETTVI